MRSSLWLTALCVGLAAGCGGPKGTADAPAGTPGQAAGGSREGDTSAVVLPDTTPAGRGRTDSTPAPRAPGTSQTHETH